LVLTDWKAGPWKKINGGDIYIKEWWWKQLNEERVSGTRIFNISVPIFSVTRKPALRTLTNQSNSIAHTFSSSSSSDSSLTQFHCLSILLNLKVVQSFFYWFLTHHHFHLPHILVIYLALQLNYFCLISCYSNYVYHDLRVTILCSS
jgi:hypothetical protein